MIYRALCDHLEMLNRIVVATECFHGMMSELGDENLGAEQAEWVLGKHSCITSTPCRLCDHSLSDFRQRLSTKLEHLGDAAMNAQRHGEAISVYSAALSLDPPAPLEGLFIRRSKAYIARGRWGDALNDANQVRSFLSRGFILVDGIIIR